MKPRHFFRTNQTLGVSRMRVNDAQARLGKRHLGLAASPTRIEVHAIEAKAGGNEVQTRDAVVGLRASDVVLQMSKHHSAISATT